MDFPILLLFAAFPAVGFLAGVLVAELYDPPPWLLGATLHAAAGVALAVFALELTPRSFAVAPGPATALAFVVGAALSLGLARLSGLLRRFSGAREGAFAVYSVAAADLISDGLMTGAGAAVSLELAAVLGGSQLVANIPSGFAATAHLQDRGGGRITRLALGGAMLIPAVAAAGVGWSALRGQPEAVTAVALAAVAGVLLCATIEDLVPEADRPRSPRGLSTAALAGGFVLLAAVSGAVGE